MTSDDAPAVALLHISGQPGTFLTNLGETFLRALYREMAVLPYCCGLVAVDGEQVIGVVTGSTASERLFKDFILRRGWKLVLPVAGALCRHPSLLPKVIETFLYPSQQPHEDGEAEMLYLSVREGRRNEGIGYALYHGMAEEFARRGVETMGLMVDETNEAAVRFHERQDMTLVSRFMLYHRPMRWYRLSLRREETSSR
jgi:ribosomal protein S18 acetylase RimI-like enzyme